MSSLVPLAGLALGAGLLLCFSPWMWPQVRRAAPTRPGAWRTRLTQAGFPTLPPATFAFVCAAFGVVAGFASFALVPVAALAIALAIVAAATPAVVVDWRARAYRRSAAVVWPDAVDQLVSAIRSGLALPDAVAALASVGPAPTRAAFDAFARDYRAAGSFTVAIDELKGRLADPVADRILETLRMAREVGGTELTAVLRALGTYLRQERAIRSEVEARQSWLRNAARLGVAAPWVVLLLLATRPEAAAAYNSAAGSVVILAGLAVSIVAYRVMIGIGRLPEERRWFA